MLGFERRDGVLKSDISGLEPLKRVHLPDGTVVLDSDLPSGCERWTPKRKAMVVAAIEGGVIGAGEAMRRYALSPEELDAWKAGRRHSTKPWQKSKGQ